MLLKVRVDGSRLRDWHVQLLKRLSKLPNLSITVDARASTAGLPQSADLLFRFEALIYGATPSLAALAVGPQLDEFAKADQLPVDLTLDLCGDVGAQCGSIWRLTFNGASSEAALLGLLLQGDTPRATLFDGRRNVMSGRLGTDNHGIMLLAFEDALARTSTLILRAFVSVDPRDLLPAIPEPKPERITVPRIDPWRMGSLALGTSPLSAMLQDAALAHRLAQAWRPGPSRTSRPSKDRMERSQG